jgi:hypothetical protein
MAAESRGLSVTMWMAAAGSAVVFLVALLLRETAAGNTDLAATQEASAALT